MVGRYGSDELNRFLLIISAILIIIGIFVPRHFLNVLVVILFERRRAEKGSQVLARIGGILFTPLGVMTVLGFGFVLLGAEPPAFLTQTVNSLAACATPLALAVIGADLDLTREKKDLFQLLAVCLIKLIAAPLAALLLTRALGFPDMYAAVAALVISVPTAVSSYPFAVNMGGDAPFSASVVAYTTVFSILTSMGWITALQLMGLA